MIFIQDSTFNVAFFPQLCKYAFVFNNKIMPLKNRTDLTNHNFSMFSITYKPVSEFHIYWFFVFYRISYTIKVYESSFILFMILG